MIVRFLRAHAWYRWRSFVNGPRGARRRDGVERLSRASEFLLPLIAGVVFVPVALALGALGILAGRAIGGGSADASVFLSIRLGLLAVVVVIVLSLTLRSAGGTSERLSRLILLPVSHRQLHFLVVLASLGDTWLAVSAIGIVAIPIGVASAAAPGAALVATLCGAAVLLALASISTLTSFAAALLLRNRRRRDLFLTVFFAALMGGPLALFSGEPVRPGSPPRALAWIEAHSGGAGGSRGLLNLVPSEPYVASLEAAAGGRMAAAWGGFVLMALLAAALFLLSERTYRALIENPASESSRRLPARRGLPASGRWPLLSPAASAVATASWQSVFRTIQGKMAAILNPLYIAGFGIILAKGNFLGADFRLPGETVAAGGVFLCLLPYSGVLFNQFAADRGGLTLQFLSPASDSDLLVGKGAAAGAMFALSVGFFLVPMAVAFPAMGLSAFATIGLGAAGSFFLYLPIAAALAALLPKAVDLGQMNAPTHQLAAMAGMFVPGLVGALPFFSARFARANFEGPLAAPLFELAWVVAAALVSVILLRPLAALLARRRENLALVAQGK